MYVCMNGKSVQEVKIKPNIWNFNKSIDKMMKKEKINEQEDNLIVVVEFTLGYGL